MANSLERLRKYLLLLLERAKRRKGESGMVEESRKTFKPYPYQVFAIQKIVMMFCIALFLDMGLGKTVITLSAIAQLIYKEHKVSKVLIIAPKKVAESVWSAEAAKWEHLKDLRLSLVLGSKAQRLKALKVDADIYVINRENTSWIVGQYGDGWPFDMVVLDESSSFKSSRTQRFQALRSVRRYITRVVELTGTPAPQSIEDLWSQIFLLDAGKRLGKYFSDFRNHYEIAEVHPGFTTWSPRPGAEQEVYQAISDIAVSMKASDYIELPELITDDIPVMLPPKATKVYKEMEKNMLLSISSEKHVTAATAAVLTGKLLQMCNGAVYSSQGSATEVKNQEIIYIHEAKLDALCELLEQLHGEHALIFYQYRHDLVRIQARLDKEGYKYAVYSSAKDAEAWNSGEIPILIAHPASTGYGLNLQYGGHHIIWFGLTWALEQYEQANARLYRQGQEVPVIVHRLVVKGGMDEQVTAALDRKKDVQSGMLDSLRARFEAIRG